MRLASSALKRFGRSQEPSIDPQVVAESLAARHRSLPGQTPPIDDVGPPRPVFILGPLRSGANLLALSLGQHANLVSVLETGWFEQFAIGLQQSYAAGLRHRNRSFLDVAGIEIEDYFAHFGETIDRLMLSSVTAGLDVPGDLKPSIAANGRASDGDAPTYRPRRWIDSTTDNAFCIFVLLRLFPEARFIHVVRDLYQVTDRLTTIRTRATYRSHHLRLSGERAYRHWYETTLSCLEAEQAFGSDVVMRLRRDDLIASPETSLRRCLDFIGEPFVRPCLRPFSSVFPTHETASVMRGGSPYKQWRLRELRTEAEALNARLLAETPTIGDGEPQSVYVEDIGKITALEMAFSERAEQGQSATPISPGNRQRLQMSVRPGANRARMPLSVVRGIIDHR